MDQNKLTVKIKGKIFQLKVTLGFWKRCGFKREDLAIIETDAEAYTKALQLAIFYGNKTEYGWLSVEDMSKMITDNDIDDLEEDFVEKISYATIHYLPEKIRKITLKKIADAEKELEEIMSDELETEEVDQDGVKKN